MYSIVINNNIISTLTTAGNYVIWNDIAGEDDSLKLIDPELSMEVNKAGTLTFTIPVTNVGYSMIEPLITVVRVYRINTDTSHKELYWSGRVATAESGFQNNLYVTCEGELSFFNDTVQLPAIYEDKTIVEFLELILAVHNANCTKPYYACQLGTVTVVKQDDLKYWSTNYETTWDCIQNMLLDEYGGILMFHYDEMGNRYLDYYNGYPQQAEGVVYQEILFGENLTDITKYWDLSSFATVVIPLGSRLNRPSIENDVVYDPGDGYIYIDPEPKYKGKTTEISEEFSRNPVLVVGDNDYRTLLEIRRYKEIVKVRYIKQDPLGSQNPKMKDLQSLDDAYPEPDEYVTIADVNDGSVMIENQETIARYGRITRVVQFDYCETPELLLAHGNKYMEDIQFSNMTIELNAVDLHNFDLNVRALNLHEYVRVISKPHHIDELLPITRLDIPLNNPGSSGLALSNDVYNPDPSFTDIVGSTVVGDGTKQKADTYVEGAKRGTYVDPAILIGFHIDGNVSDPYNKVTYVEAAEGMTPAHMDFANDVFDYGDWEDAFFMPKPCILGHDGTVIKYLDPNDYTKDIDGNTVVIDSNLQNAEVMIEFPKIYRKIVPDDNDPYSATVYFSNALIDFGFKDYAYINKRGIHQDHFYVAAFEGSQYTSGGYPYPPMRSIYNRQPFVEADLSGTSLNFREQAELNGTDWFITTYADVELINLLLILMAKSTDFNTAYGTGAYAHTNTEVHVYKNGIFTYNKGLFHGTYITTTYSTKPVKVFGIENWYGLCADMFCGLLPHGYDQYVYKMCFGIEDGSTSDDYGANPGWDSGYGYILTSGETRHVTSTNKGAANIDKFNWSRGVMLPYLPAASNQNTTNFTINYCSGMLSAAGLGTDHGNETAYFGRSATAAKTKDGGLSFIIGDYTVSAIAGARLTYR